MELRRWFFSQILMEAPWRVHYMSQNYQSSYIYRRARGVWRLQKPILNADDENVYVQDVSYYLQKEQNNYSTLSTCVNNFIIFFIIVKYIEENTFDFLEFFAIVWGNLYTQHPMPENIIYLITILYASAWFIALAWFLPTLRDLFIERKNSANALTTMTWAATNGIATLYGYFVVEDLLFTCISWVSCCCFLAISGMSLYLSKKWISYEPPSL